MIGVINQPIIGDYLVGTGDGALAQRPAGVSHAPCARVEDAILLTTDHWKVFNHQNGPAYETLTRRAKRYNNWGDCHGYHLVATGGAHIMMDPIMNEWDLMALIPIVGAAAAHHRLPPRRPGRQPQPRRHQPFYFAACYCSPLPRSPHRPPAPAPPCPARRPRPSPPAGRRPPRSPRPPGPSPPPPSRRGRPLDAGPRLLPPAAAAGAGAAGRPDAARGDGAGARPASRRRCVAALVEPRRGSAR